MKTYGERCEGVSNKIQKLKKQRRLRWGIAATACMLLVTTLALVLFIPFSTNPPDVSQYSGSPYYSLIQKINEATYVKPAYKNNFQLLCSKIEKFAPSDGKQEGIPMPGNPAEDGMNGGAATGTNGSYVEVTDNQVAGVTEADIIKRTDKYIFYLRGVELFVYTIKGEDSEFLCSHTLIHEYEEIWFAGKREMYLSQDGSTITVVAGVVMPGDKTAGTMDRRMVTVQNFTLEVTPETAMLRPGESVYVSGDQISSRMVDGKLLLMTNFHVDYNKDFGKEETFLPQVGTEPTGDMMESVAPENIVEPETLSNTYYTVVTYLDTEELEILDTAAFLSYTGSVYVSRERIYATRSYLDSTGNKEGEDLRRSMTEIACIAYGNGKLEPKGSVKVHGNVKNQYSMDENEGILRVVTSHDDRIVAREVNGITEWSKTIRNANLFCISLENFSIVASVESFAPEGEQAESVRFDGKYAYVCTAEVITLTDPVYFFDLSDLKNITWKDTGTIDGYSSSLVNFGDGFLIGIGYGESRGLKIEVYEETEDAVKSVCAYEREAEFCEDYKCYYIDREAGFIGLAIYDWTGDGMEYVLLHFDGSQLTEVVKVPVLGTGRILNNVRGLVIDDCLYVLAEEFDVVKFR